MRLYLSSYRMGTAVSELEGVIGPKRSAALIGNALDSFPTGRTAALERQAEDLEGVGCECEEIDLRGYFGRESDLVAAGEKLPGSAEVKVPTLARSLIEVRRGLVQTSGRPDRPGKTVTSRVSTHGYATSS